MKFHSVLGFSLVLACAAGASAQIDRPISEEVVYHFMPIAWRDSDNDQFRYGDFNGMAASLDYLQELGVTAVWMNPIFNSPAYHGYQHFEPNSVNARHGTEAQWWAFVNAAHARGIKVYLDIVAYGMNRSSTYFTSAFNNPASPFDTWIAFTNSANSQFTGYSFTTWDGTTVRFANWDLRTPACRDQMIAWCRKWVDPNNDLNPSDGIDGWRIDHAWVQYNQGPDGWGYNLDDFWTPWHNDLRARHPKMFTFVEQADWGSQGSEFLPVFNGAVAKQLLFGLRSAAANENAQGVYDQMIAAWSSLPADALATNRTFLASLGDHDVDRAMSAIGNNFGRARAAAAVILTGPFTPMIYYGDELGMTGTKGAFGSDADDIPMREPFKWNAVAGPPMSNYFVRNTGAYNARFSRDNDGRSVQEQRNVPGSLLETHKSLIAVRKASVALKRGTYTPVTNSSPAVFACIRHADASRSNGAPPQTVLVAINLSGSTVNATLDLSGTTLGGASVAPLALFGPALPTITNANKGACTVTLAPYATAIAQVDLVPPTPAPAPADIDGRNIVADMGVINPVDSMAPTQTCATGFGNNLNELNRLLVKALPAGPSGSLRVGITGNLETNGNSIVLLLDTLPGGQQVIDTSSIPPPPDGLPALTGLALDTGFTPDRLFFINGSGGSLYVDRVILPSSPASASKAYLGRSTYNSGNALLVAGSNPNNVYAAMDNTNTGGITGTSVTGAASVATGLEMIIPYAELAPGGLPCGTIRVAALIAAPDGTVSNQVLPGLPFGTPNLGVGPSLASYSGNQFGIISIPALADVDNGTGTGTRDGGVGIEDLLYFLGVFEGGLIGADVDDGSGTGIKDGGVGIEDLLYYLQRFEAGC